MNTVTRLEAGGWRLEVQNTVFRPAASRPQPPVPACGFTLLEVLVVIVIIGIIVASMTIGVGVLGRDREAEDQARRIWAVLQQAREENELQSLDLGVFVSSTAYEFLRYDARRNAWLPMTDDDLYASRELPEGLRFRLRLDSREVVLKPDAVDREDKDEDKKWPPQIMLLSSGDIMPFELEFEREAAPALWRVVGHTDSNLTVERRSDDLAQWQIVAETKPPEEDDEDERGFSDVRR